MSTAAGVRLPITPTWLAKYNRTTFRCDLVAGITLAAYLLPAALADASLANLPPESGLYACVFSGLVFWLFTSSRHTAITVTSGLSLLVGASLGELAGGDATRFAALASATTILVGLLSFAAWLVKAGVVVNFISETVLIGFKFGIALVLISTQLPKFFGFSGTHGDFWERLHYFFHHLDETNLVALSVGITALTLLILGKVFLKHRPTALVVLVLGVASSAILNLHQYGVKFLGEVPQGLPTLGVPPIRWTDLNELLPLAMACFLLGAVETVAIGRMFARKHNYRFEANREFLALGMANIGAGLGRGFPVSGGMSQSLVNESANAKTPLSTLFATILMMVVALFLSGMLRDLPQPVLAAIVLLAVTGLIKVRALIHLWHFSRGEFFVALAAFLGVISSGILRGVLIGAILSLGLLLRRASRPHTAELGRVPGTNFYADLLRHPENEREPEVFIFRSEGALLYFNVEYVADRFAELLSNRTDNVRLAIFYLGMVPIIDLAGVEMLTELEKSLHSRGIDFRLAETRGQIRESLRRAGFEKHHRVPIVANQSVETVLQVWKRRTPSQLAKQRS